MSDGSAEKTEAGDAEVSELVQRFKKHFLDALYADFAAHAADAIAACRVDNPLQYIKLIASLLPKERAARAPRDVSPQGEELAHLSDEDLLTRIRSIEAAIDESISTSTTPSEPCASADGTQTADRHPAADILPPLR